MRRSLFVRTVLMCATLLPLSFAGVARAFADESIAPEWRVDGTPLWSPEQSARKRWMMNTRGWMDSIEGIDRSLLDARCFVSEQDGRLAWARTFTAQEAERDGRSLYECVVTATFPGSRVSCRSVYSAGFNELETQVTLERSVDKVLPEGRIRRIENTFTIKQDRPEETEAESPEILMTDELPYVLALARAPEAVYLIPSLDLTSRKAGATAFRVVRAAAGGGGAVKVLLTTLANGPENAPPDTARCYLFDADGKLLQEIKINEPEAPPLREVTESEWRQTWETQVEALAETVASEPQ